MVFVNVAQMMICETFTNRIPLSGGTIKKWTKGCLLNARMFCGNKRSFVLSLNSPGVKSKKYEKTRSRKCGSFMFHVSYKVNLFFLFFCFFVFFFWNLGKDTLVVIIKIPISNYPVQYFSYHLVFTLNLLNGSSAQRYEKSLLNILVDQLSHKNMESCW